MNDRFKFRVWDKESKCLHYPTRYSNFAIVNGTVVKIESYPTANSAYLGKRIAWEFDDAVIMQSTGLKDKNGKLIYEGDIVSDKSNHIRVVVWEQDCFKYPVLKTSRYFHRPISNQLEERKIGLRGKLTFQDAIGKCDKKHFEVIGNIYENKELLESEG